MRSLGFFHSPRFHVAQLNTKVDAQQDDLLAAAPVWLGVAPFLYLAQGGFCALIAFELDDVHLVGEGQCHINTPPVG